MDHHGLYCMLKYDDFYSPNIAQAGAPVDINHVMDQVSNNYLMDNVECVGTERDIEQCPRATNIDCDPNAKEYASVTCTRLIDTQPQGIKKTFVISVLQFSPQKLVVLLG